MAKDIRSISRRARLGYGMVCVVLGCYPIALALGIIPVDDGALTAPRSVVGGAGLVFVVAGLMILLANNSRANDILAGVLLLLFGAIGAWVSLLSSDDGFSGGLPFLSSELNILVGRWVFGLGALICFALSFYAFRRAVIEMRIRSWFLGVIAGLLAGLLVSVPMTVMDWRLNPAGLFHNEQGTDWNIVLETAFSWFWPIALPVLLATVIVHSWKTFRR